MSDNHPVPSGPATPALPDPPVGEPRTLPPRLASDDVVIAAPMSFAGSAERLWKPVRRHAGWAAIGMGSLMAVTIALVWCLVLFWYCFFGLLLVPYRLIRRSSRRQKREQLRHRELLSALERENRS